jgi:hypothetical protein
MQILRGSGRISQAAPPTIGWLPVERHQAIT